MKENENMVDPNNLEEWLLSNKVEVYKKSIEAANDLVADNTITQKLMVEFSWEDEIYAKIYMKRSDVPNAMQKAIEYFVENELYEEAQIAKNINDKFYSKKLS
jgi:hypothetical protein